jgi:uncharacterized protein (DUF2252 family)
MPNLSRNYPKPTDRAAILLERKNKKMAQSPHAYVRGNTAQFYDWLNGQRGHRLPKGPPVWICGDCHLGNLGPLADANGEVGLYIRDFDQTLIGNPAHDLVRLALSLATAARGSSLPGVVTAHMLERMMDGYDIAMARGDDGSVMRKPLVIEEAVRNARRRSWKQLATERIVDTSPNIPLGKNFWPLSTAEKKGIRDLFAQEEVVSLVTSFKAREDNAQVKLVDAAYWVKGCSSLGLLRYAVLVSVGTEHCLIDIKEATQATAPRYSRISMPRDNARRVVAGATLLSPALGERMLATRFLGHGVFMRELMPQDLKLEIDELSMEDATLVAEYLAYVVGLSHAQQMDVHARREWRACLRTNRSKTLDTPEWLWNSVVSLVANHEAGYLEHCRRFALPSSQARRS